MTITLSTSTNEATQRVTVQIEQDGKPLAHAIFDPPEFDQLIRQLAAERVKLTDAFPLTVDPGSRLETVVDPAWHSPDANPEGTKLLALRHPGFGWLGFQFPEHEAAAVAERLNKQGASPEMIEAGIAAWAEWDESDDYSATNLVVSVFQAMSDAR